MLSRDAQPPWYKHVLYALHTCSTEDSEGQWQLLVGAAQGLHRPAQQPGALHVCLRSF